MNPKGIDNDLRKRVVERVKKMRFLSGQQSKKYGVDLKYYNLLREFLIQASKIERLIYCILIFIKRTIMYHPIIGIKYIKMYTKVKPLIENLYEYIDNADMSVKTEALRKLHYNLLKLVKPIVFLVINFVSKYTSKKDILFYYNDLSKCEHTKQDLSKCLKELDLPGDCEEIFKINQKRNSWLFIGKISKDISLISLLARDLVNIYQMKDQYTPNINKWTTQIHERFMSVFSNDPKKLNYRFSNLFKNKPKKLKKSSVSPITVKSSPKSNLLTIQQSKNILRGSISPITVKSSPKSNLLKTQQSKNGVRGSPFTDHKARSIFIKQLQQVLESPVPKSKPHIKTQQFQL